MADSQNSDLFDDLDAFFSAAAGSDPNAIEQAAQNVVEGSRPSAPSPVSKKSTTTVHGKTDTSDYTSTDDLYDTTDTKDGDLEGKFIAIDPESIAGGNRGEPFILVPANVHALLPWWVWATIGLGLAVMVLGVVLMPKITLNRLTAKLGDGNPATAQSIMRQLVIKGDEQTVGKLYDLAVAKENNMATRLRAVDTLSLINAPDADRALLRLELASGTDAQVREAAIAARKQREAAKTRNR